MDRGQLGSDSGHLHQIPGHRHPYPVLLSHQRHQLARPLRLDHTLVDDGHPVTEPLGLLHVVGGVEDCYSLARKVFDRLEDGVPRLGIDPDRRLIQYEQTGPMEQPDTDVQFSLHAAGELADEVVLAFGETDHLEHLLHAFVQFLAGHVVETPEEPEILGRGQIGVYGDLLGYQADVRPTRGRIGPDRGPGHVDGAVVGLQEPGHHRDRSGLACPIGAEEPEGLPLCYLEADPVHRDQITKALDEPFRRQDRRSTPLCRCERHPTDGEACRCRLTGGGLGAAEPTLGEAGRRRRSGHGRYFDSCDLADPRTHGEQRVASLRPAIRCFSRDRVELAVQLLRGLICEPPRPGQRFRLVTGQVWLYGGVRLQQRPFGDEELDRQLHWVGSRPEPVVVDEADDAGHI